MHPIDRESFEALLLETARLVHAQGGEAVEVAHLFVKYGLPVKAATRVMFRAAAGRKGKRLVDKVAEHVDALKTETRHAVDLLNRSAWVIRHRLEELSPPPPVEVPTTRYTF